MLLQRYNLFSFWQNKILLHFSSILIINILCFVVRCIIFVLSTLNFAFFTPFLSNFSLSQPTKTSPVSPFILPYPLLSRRIPSSQFMNNLWNIILFVLTLVAGGGWLFDRHRHRQEVESLRADNRQKDMNARRVNRTPMKSEQ